MSFPPFFYSFSLCLCLSLQEQRNRQRRAGRLRGAQVAVELQGLRQELGSMKTAFKRSAKQLFEEVAESFLAGVRLAQQKQAQTADAAAALSLTVFLASKQHIAQELHCAALAGKQLRADLNGLKQALGQGKSRFKRDAESILEAIRRHADTGQKELAALKAQRILWTNERTQLQHAAALGLSQVAASKAATAKAEDKLTSAQLELSKTQGELVQVKVVLNETKGAAAKERERVAKETEVLVFQKSSLSETSAKTIVDLQTQVWRFQAAQSVAPLESPQISSKKPKPRDVNAQFYAAEGLDYYIPQVERPSVSKKGVSPSTIMSSSPSPQRAPSAPIPPLAACGHCEDGLASILEVEKKVVVLGVLAETAGWEFEGKRTQGSEKEKERKNQEEMQEEESGPKRGGGKRGREMRGEGGFAGGDASGNHRSARREGERCGEGSMSSTATNFEQQQKAVQKEVQENQKGQQKEGGMAMDQTEKERQKQPSRELLQQPLQAKLQQPLPSCANSNKRQREMTDVEGKLFLLIDEKNVFFLFSFGCFVYSAHLLNQEPHMCTHEQDCIVHWQALRAHGPHAHEHQISFLILQMLCTSFAGAAPPSLPSPHPHPNRTHSRRIGR